MNILTRLAAASTLVLGLAAPAVALDVTFAGPESATGNYLAGQQALSELRTQQAAQFFRDAAADEYGNPMVVDRAFIAFAADGQIDQAADTARHVLELEPTNDMAKLVLATQAFKQRRYEAAVSDLDKLNDTTFEGITGAQTRNEVMGRALDHLLGNTP